MTFQFLHQLEELHLTEEEHDYLRKHGAWLSRLESGAIVPNTAPQRRFVEVVNGRAPPEAPHEHLWLRVRLALAGQARVAKLQNEIRKLQEQLKSARSSKRSTPNILISPPSISTHAPSVIAEQKEELDRLNRIVTIQDAKIAKLLSTIAQLQTSGLPSSSSRSPVGLMCIQCGGDGGAGGRCPHCGGNGFEPART